MHCLGSIKFVVFEKKLLSHIPIVKLCPVGVGVFDPQKKK
jgi:hypothetical protein